LLELLRAFGAQYIDQPTFVDWFFGVDSALDITNLKEHLMMNMFREGYGLG
jgi:hypothetical protein